VIEERRHAQHQVFRSGDAFGFRPGVDIEDVGEGNLPRITVAAPFGLPAGGDVFGELSLSSRKVCLAAASANSVSVGALNVPDGRASVRGRLKPESGWFGDCRHRTLISSIAASVVNCLPAILSTASRPRAASRRKPEAVIPPPGKASSAALERRSGACGLMAAGVILSTLIFTLPLIEDAASALVKPLSRPLHGFLDRKPPAQFGFFIRRQLKLVDKAAGPALSRPVAPPDLDDMGAAVLTVEFPAGYVVHRRQLPAYEKKNRRRRLWGALDEIRRRLPLCGGSSIY
jgi:hypothetical protein